MWSLNITFLTTKTHAQSYRRAVGAHFTSNVRPWPFSQQCDLWTLTFWLYFRSTASGRHGLRLYQLWLHVCLSVCLCTHDMTNGQTDSMRDEDTITTMVSLHILNGRTSPSINFEVKGSKVKVIWLSSAQHRRGSAGWSSSSQFRPSFYDSSTARYTVKISVYRRLFCNKFSIF